MDDIKTPMHLWIVGIVSLLWNAMGAMDYVLVMSNNAEYLSQMSQEALAYFAAFPMWVIVAWTVAIWFSVAGSVVLLMKSRFAVTFFAIALVGIIANLIYGFLISDIKTNEISGPVELVFSAVILIVAVLLLRYSGRMQLAGVLR